MYTLELARPDELQTCWEIIAMGEIFRKNRDSHNGPKTILIRIRSGMILRHKKGM